MYDLNSEFNIELHKKHYVHYLEVIILPDGSVKYAVPSHQEFLINFALNKLKISRDEFYKMCPKEYYFDILTWLCGMTDCVSVWGNQIYYFNINHDQLSTLRQLRSEGLYLGNIPYHPVTNKVL